MPHVSDGMPAATHLLIVDVETPISSASSRAARGLAWGPVKKRLVVVFAIDERD